MIKTFGDKCTRNLWKEKSSLKLKNIQKVALRKLEQLDKAKNLLDLTFPPHNRLEALRGEWRGYYSIRINRQRTFIKRSYGVCKTPYID